ncbi:MAG: alpha/beta hydrolase family protein [Kaistella sp.]
MKNIQTEKNIHLISSEKYDFLADAFYPENGENLPLIIFVHGYKGYKDWGAWNLMAEKFAKSGFYFVKFNFSHNGTTVEEPNNFADLNAFGNNNYSKEMADFEVVVNYFTKTSRIDSSKICVMGHSRGGGIAVLKAFEDDRIKALITLAGVSNFENRFVHGQQLEDWKNSGVIFSENKRTQQQMPHYFQFFEDFKKNEKRFDIQKAAQNLEKPFLIIHGTADEAVNSKEAYLLKEWCKTAKLALIENATHTFGAKEPWSEATLPKDLEKAIDESVEFLRRHL